MRRNGFGVSFDPVKMHQLTFPGVMFSLAEAPYQPKYTELKLNGAGITFENSVAITAAVRAVFQEAVPNGSSSSKRRNVK